VEIRDVRSFEEFINALNQLGINVTDKDVAQFIDQGKLMRFPPQIPEEGVVVSYDFLDKMRKDGFAYSIMLRGKSERTYIYKIVIGPKLIQFARVHQDLNFITFAIDHEIGHLYDHKRPRGIPHIWYLARDVVINEALLQRYSQNTAAGTLFIIKPMVITKDSLNEQILATCEVAGVSDCDKYLITDKDLYYSKLPSLVTYDKILTLYKKIPEEAKEMLRRFVEQYHGEGIEEQEKIEREK